MSTHLGGTASDVVVGKVGHGLMLMTWREPPVVADEIAFEAIKAGLDRHPSGVKAVLNTGEFYGVNPRTSNLELVSRFFEKYPEYTDKAFLSVKGGSAADSLLPLATEENIRRSVDTINEKLRGKKRMDLFQMARIDPNHPVEETIGILAKLIKEGKFDHIGVSECTAATLRRAHGVHPITAIEIEVSPWSYEEETKNVIATAKELGVTVIAYSPLGRGFLTGAIQDKETLGKDRHAKTQFTRFKAENFDHNKQLVDALAKISARKGITNAQLCIAWVSSRGDHVIPIPGSSHIKRTLENYGAGDVKLTPEEVAELDHLVDNFEAKGDRYFGNDRAALLWG